MRNTPHCITLITAATLVAASSASAATTTLADHKFDTTADGWIAYGVTTPTWANDSTLGNALTVVTNGTARGAQFQFTDQLLNVGDALSVTLDFRFTASPADNTGGIRLALGDKKGTGSLTNDMSYFAYYGTGSNYNQFGLRRDLGTANTIFTGTDSADLTTGVSTVPDAAGLNDMLKHSLGLTITRVSTGYEVSGSLDGVTYLSNISDTTPPNFTAFNSLVIGSGTGYTAGTEPQFAIDNVRLDYISAVPEPSAALLGGLGLLGLLRRRRA